MPCMPCIAAAQQTGLGLQGISNAHVSPWQGTASCNPRREQLWTLEKFSFLLLVAQKAFYYIVCVRSRSSFYFDFCSKLAPTAEAATHSTGQATEAAGQGGSLYQCSRWVSESPT